MEPLTIGMNDEFGMLFEGRLVAPAELSRLLREALKENPGRVVAIDLPKRPWTVAEHVDQLEQIARIAGAMWITRPAWSQIRIVMSVDKSGEHTLDIEGPDYSSTGLLEDQRRNVREVIAKNPNLPVQIEVVEPFRFSDPKNIISLAKVRDATKAAGDKVRIVRTRAKDDRQTVPLPPIRIGMNDKGVPTFNGRLVPPQEQADLLIEALKENPDHEVVIDLPKSRWTVVPHVDQLEQVARTAGAKRITRPAWSQVRIVFGVAKLAAGGPDQTFVSIEAPGLSVAGEFLMQRLPSGEYVDSEFLEPQLRSSVIKKYPGLPVLLDVRDEIDPSDPRKAAHIARVRRLLEAAGAKVRLGPGLDNVNPPKSLGQIQELHRLQSHTGSIERLAFIDNTRFVSAGLSGEEFVWDARQGKRVQTLTEPDRLLTAVAAAPAAGLFATGNSYGQIRLWNKDLTTTGTIKGPETILQTLAMSADGSLLMSSGVSFVQDPALLAKDLMPRIWNTKTQELVRTLDSKSGLIMAAAFTPDGKRLVTGGMAKQLSVWNVATGELLSTIELGMEVRTLSLSPDGRLAAVASSDPVVIVDLQTKEVTHRFNGHTLRVQTVAFLPDGRHVVSGSQDKTCRVWSLADSREVAQVAGTTPHTHGLAISPDGKLVAGGGGEPYDHATKSFPKNGDYDLRVWELPESLWATQGDGVSRTVVELSVDGQVRLEGRPVTSTELVTQLQTILKANPEREVHVIPAAQFRGGPFRLFVHVVRSAGAKNVTWPAGLSDQVEPVRQFVGHTNMVKSVAFSPDGKLIASASGFPLGDNTVRIWDRESGAVLHELDLHRIPVVFAVFSPDGQRLLSGDTQGKFILWDPNTGRSLKNWRNDGIMIDEAVFTPNGAQIVFLKNDASAANAAVQELEKTPPSKIDPEALKLRLESLTKRTIQVVNATDGTLVKSIPLDAVASPGVAVTPDGRHVVVPMYDGTVRMLELATGQETRRFAAPETDPPAQPVMAFSAAVSPNGEKLAAGYSNRTVRVWNLNTGEMLREIRTTSRTTSSSAGRVVFFADNRRLAFSGPVLQTAPHWSAASVLDSETGNILVMTPAILNRALGDGFAFALAPDQQHILTAGGGYYDNQTRQWKGTGDYALRLWKLSDLGEIDTSKLPRMDDSSIHEVQRFRGHKAPVRSVAFSPDGKLIASAGGYSADDYTVRIWDRESGRGLHVTEEHKAAVMFVAFSPDGSRLLTGDLNRRQYLWNPATGEKAGEWIRKADDLSQISHINEVVFSPDGARIYFVQVGKKPAICIADAASGELLNQFPLEQAARPSIDLTRDGLQLLVPCSDGTVLLMDAKNGKTLRTYAAPKTVGTYSVSAWVARQSPDGAKVAVGYTASMIRIWDFESGGVLRDIPAPDVMTNHLAFLADSRHLVAAGGPHDPKSKSPVAFLFDTETGEELARAPTTLKTVRAFALSPDQRHLLTDGGQYASQKGAVATGDFDLRLWRLPESVWPEARQASAEPIQLAAKLTGHAATIKALRFMPGDGQLLSLAGDKTLRTWDVASHEAKVTQLPLEGSIDDADFSFDGSLAAVSVPRIRQAHVWNVAESKEIVKFAPSELYAERIVFSPNGSKLLLSGKPALGKVYDAKTGNELDKFVMRDEASTGAAFSADGRHVALSVPQEMSLWRTKDHHRTGNSWSTWPSSSCLAMGNELWAAGYIDGKVFMMWVNHDAPPKTEVHPGLFEGVGRVTHLEFFDGDRFLLITWDSGMIRIADLTTSKVVAEAQGPPGCAAEAALSSDRRYLATGGGDVWDEKLGRKSSAGDYLIYLWRLPKSVWPQPKQIGLNRSFEVDGKKLIGQWKSTDKEAKSWIASAEFQADGKLSVTSDINGMTHEAAGTYQVDGYKLFMKIGGQALDEELTIFRLTDEVLVAAAKNGKKLNFERVEAKK